MNSDFAEEELSKFADEKAERHGRRPSNRFVDGGGSRPTPVYNNPYIAPGASAGNRSHCDHDHDANLTKTQQLLEQMRIEGNEPKTLPTTAPPRQQAGQPQPQKRKFYRKRAPRVRQCQPSCPERSPNSDSTVFKAPQKSFPEMVKAAIVGLNRTGQVHHPFSKIVSYVRNNFQLSLSANQSLEDHVLKALNEWMSKGLVGATEEVRQKDGTLEHVPVPVDKPPEQNLALRGQRVPEVKKSVKTGIVLPELSSSPLLGRSVATWNCPVPALKESLMNGTDLPEPFRTLCRSGPAEPGELILQPSFQVGGVANARRNKILEADEKLFKAMKLSAATLEHDLSRLTWEYNRSIHIVDKNDPTSVNTFGFKPGQHKGWVLFTEMNSQTRPLPWDRITEWTRYKLD